jgi:ADP-heptose:LPS heptosyltransferase
MELLKTIDPYCWWPSVVSGRVLSLLRRDNAVDAPAVIIRPGGMGDLIMLCVAIEAIGRDPREFFWVIEKRSALWAQQLGLDYLCYDTQLAKLLALRGRYKTVINSEQSFGLSQAVAVALRAQGGRVYGFSTNRATGASDSVVSYDPLNAHESVEFARLVAAAHGTQLYPLAVPVRQRLRPVEGCLVVGIAGLQVESRRFGLDHWVAIVAEWAQSRDVTIVAGPPDREFAQALRERLGSGAVLFNGTFAAMCDFVSRAEGVLTVDGGFVHIASYYGIPTTAIFTSGVDRKWAPIANGSRIVKRDDLACRPCTRFGQVPACRSDYRCKDFDLSLVSLRSNQSIRKDNSPCLNCF